MPTEPACGCGTIVNAAQVEGNVALIERGECSFISKTMKAQEAGAIAAIITDNNKDNDELYISMQDDTTGRQPDIPSAFLLGANGEVIRRTLNKLHLNEAIINLPINITSIPINELNQPPWLVWRSITNQPTIVTYKHDTDHRTDIYTY